MERAVTKDFGYGLYMGVHIPEEGEGCDFHSFSLICAYVLLLEHSLVLPFSHLLRAAHPIHYIFHFFITLFLENGREGERERNISASHVPLTCPLLGTWSTTQAHALTGNRTSNPLVCRPAQDPLSHTGQDHYSFLFL